MHILIPLFLGVLFGAALNKGGLTQYKNIVGVFRFTNLTVIKFMLTAVCVAMTGLFALNGLGLISLPQPPATYVLGNLLGGLVFGVGMALAGYCPGTCAAGSGEGKLDYLLTGIPGLLAGAVIFGLVWPSFFPALREVANLGQVNLAQLWDASPFLVVIAFVLLVAFLFYLLERNRLYRKDKLD
ncbi:MAG TPA: YeeE/YedE thiosulfate transporter family protein [Anaerolineaceae bacterium]|nr:YeeE/YedE thiosulfate transporter family protein [Anaerolineaceae bacterium]HPN50481.1 YeeE/YedE thiosulfate transporter family protein [Anaerolineaceae bacterium]